MNKKYRTAKTIVISGMSVVLSYFINLFLTSFLTENVGVDAYGYVSIAKTFVSYAGIITIALTAFIVRYITISYNEGNIKESRSYYSSAIISCLVLVGVIFVAGTIISLNLEKFLKVDASLVKSVKLLFILVLINFLITTIVTPFGSAAYIKNHLDYVGIIKILSYIVEAVVLVVMFKKLTPYVWYVGVGAICAAIVILIGNYWIKKRLTPDLKFDFGLVKISKVKNLVSNGIWNSVNQLGNILNNGLDLWISNLMLSPILMGQVSIIKTICVIFVQLCSTTEQPFQPRLLKSYASKNEEYFLSEMRVAMNVCGLFSAVAFAGFFAVGKLYYKLWLPSQDSTFLYCLTMAAVINYVTDGISRPIYYVSTLTLKNKIPCFVTIGGGFLNVMAMYFLLKYTNLGAFAVVSTTTVIMVGINLFFNPIYAAKCLSIKAGFFYRIIFRHVISIVVMLPVFYIINQIISPKTWIGLIFAAGIMFIFGVFIYVFINCSAMQRKKIMLKVQQKKYMKK